MIIGNALRLLILNSDIPIMGAPGETVTYSGTESGSVTLNSSGNGTITLRPGTYSFTGSLSGTKSNVNILPGTTVTMWPDNATIIYWYGRFGSGVILNIQLGGTNYANRSVTTNTNNMVLNAQSRAYPSSTRHNTYASVYFTGVSTTGRSTLHYNVSAVSGTSGGSSTRSLGQSASAGTADFPNIITNAGTYSYTLLSMTSYPYIGARQYHNSNTSTSWTSHDMTLAAVWLT